MENIEIKKLQNGSDIRGVALPGVPGEEVNLTESAIENIVSGFVVWLCNASKCNATGLKVAIGHDSRLSADAIKQIVMRRLSQLNVDVKDAGLASTPAMFMSTIFPEYDCDAAIMITASHLPKNRNGFKFFDKNGGLNKSDITKILQVAHGLSRTKTENDQTSDENPTTNANSKIGTTSEVGTIEKIPLMDTYCESLQDVICNALNTQKDNKPLSDLHIVVDAGNGAGGFYATKVLEPLGANIEGSQFLDPDGNFPNHVPNPEDKEAMASIKTAVLNNNADLGLIFDTDVDRSSAVDATGNGISRNRIVALAAALVAKDHPGTTIVTDSITSTGLKDFLENHLQLQHHRFKRGYKNVINEAIRLNDLGIDSQLAIETSGHAALKENYFLDDGAYLATKIVIKTAELKKLGQTLDSILADLIMPEEEAEFRLKITADDFSPYGDEIIEGLRLWIPTQVGIVEEQPNHEGVRLNFDKTTGDGWALLRKSLHDPILPLNIESNKVGGVKEISKKLMDYLSNWDYLDTSKISDSLK